MHRQQPEKTFVVMYNGREGSSALISKLSLHPGIHVPCFEDLDRMNLKQVFPQPDEHIAGALDGALRRGVVPGREKRTYDGQPVIGFKWRPFGDEAVIDTLVDNRTVVVFMHRREPLRMALSKSFHPEHLQFRVNRMAAGEREAFLRGIHAESFTADPVRVAELLSAYLDAKRRIWRRYCEPARARGLELVTLPYELFEQDPVSALNLVLRPLHLEPFQSDPRSYFVKVMSRDIEEQCTNLAEVRADPAVQGLLAELDGFLGTTGLAPSPGG